MNPMWEAALGLGDQLRWAAQLRLPQLPSGDRVLVTGMGGSGISGDIAGLLAAESGRLALVHKSYGLPGWAARERPLVVAVSYSGNTEETLSAVAAAQELRLSMVAISTGGKLADTAQQGGVPHVGIPSGLQPRAALGYLAGAVCRVLEGAGVLPNQAPGLEEAALVLDSLFGKEGKGPGAQLADDLAEGLVGRIPVIYGGPGLTGVAALRWKTQFNENAKRAAYASWLPELDHNELVGWASIPELTRRLIGIVELRDHTEHPRVAKRFELTRQIAGGDVAFVGNVWAQGETTWAKLASLIGIGDLVSLFVAAQAGVDPLPVAPIEMLKQRLAEE